MEFSSQNQKRLAPKDQDERASSRPQGVPRYGRVYFDARRQLGLSVGEYLFLDVVHTLSRRTGWCYASRQYLAETFGVSVRSIQRLVARLEERGLLEVAGDSSRQVRPTEYFLRAKADIDQ